MPKTYWIARVDLTGDPETYKKYVETAKPAFERHKARFIARGGKTEVLEGKARGRDWLSGLLLDLIPPASIGAPSANSPRTTTSSLTRDHHNLR